MPVFNPALRYFERVARGNSMRKAADLLNVAPSAINRQIIHLEQDLGTPLFERLPRGMRLTAAGEIALGYVRRWHAEEARLRDELRSLSGALVGTMRIATAEAFTHEILPLALTLLRKQLPGIRAQINVGDADYVAQAVLSGNADVGIAYNVPDSPNVQAIQQLSILVGAVMPPGHPLATRNSVTFKDCAPYPVVLPDDSLMVRSSLRPVMETGNEPFKVAAQANRIGAIKSMVSAGIGIGFLTLLDVGAELRAGTLHFVPLHDRRLRPPVLSVVIARSGKLPIAGSVFVEYLRRTLREQTGPKGA